MLNQRQIKNYEVDTLAELKLLNGRNREICFCTENQSFYRFDDNGGAYTTNDTTIVITSTGGDTRWLAISGKYNLNGGSTGSSEYVSLEVTQVDHGFDNHFIYNNGTNWVKARSDVDTTLATHFAVRVSDDVFKLIVIGEIDSSTMTDDQDVSLVNGTYYYLSSTVDGKVTSTAPSIAQGVLKQNTNDKATVSIEIAFSIAEIEGAAFKGEDNIFTATNTFDKEVVIKQISTPTNPSAGYNKLYFKNDNELYKKSSSGTETKVGGGAYVVQSKTTTYTALITDDLIFCNGTFTVTLPPANTWAKPITVKNIGTGVITVDGSGSETIDDVLSTNLLQYDSITMMSDGTDIFAIGLA